MDDILGLTRLVLVTPNVRAKRTRYGDGLHSDGVLALHKAACKLSCSDVSQENVMAERTEQWDSTPEQYRDTRDDEPLDESCCQESLNRDSAVDVEMLETSVREFLGYLDWFARHVLHDRARWPRCQR